MSWNTYLTVDMNQDVSKQLDEHFEENPALEEHGGSQIAAVKEAILGLLTVVARPEDQITLSLTGHYNPDNEPRAGWANNLISINMNQKVRG